MIYLEMFSLLGVSTSSSCTFVGESQSMSCMGGGSPQPHPQPYPCIEVRCIIEAIFSFNLLKTPCWRNMLEAFSTIGEKHNEVTYNYMRMKGLKTEVISMQAKLERLEN